jgi:hypothetical protein
MEDPETKTLEEEAQLSLPIRATQPTIDYLPYWKDANTRQKVRICLFNAAVYLPVATKLTLILTIYPIYVVLYVVPMLADRKDPPELYYWHTSKEHRLAQVQALVLLSLLTYFLFMYFLSFYRAACTSPGSVPDSLDWKLLKTRHPGDSPNAKLFLERKQTTGEVRTCSRCAKLKPDRSHHCRLCDTCVLKMDHHCPWIANCVGYYNYKYFFLMVTYGMLGLWVVTGSLWQTVVVTQRNDDSSFAEIVFVTTVYLIIIVLNVAVTCFWFFHIYLISQAHTTIEFCEKRRKKALDEEVTSSLFNLGIWNNFKDALGQNPLLWPFPCCKALFRLPKV